MSGLSYCLHCSSKMYQNFLLYGWVQEEDMDSATQPSSEYILILLPPSKGARLCTTPLTFVSLEDVLDQIFSILRNQERSPLRKLTCPTQLEEHHAWDWNPSQLQD